MKKEIKKTVKKEKKSEKATQKDEKRILSKTCKTCAHIVDMHYGSEHKWCNVNMCTCQKLEE